MKIEELRDKISYIKDIAWYGCSNHYCKFNPIEGRMKTNMLCKCEKEIKRVCKEIIGSLGD